MKYFANIFCSRPDFKLVVIIVFSILLILLAFSSNMIPSDSFSKSGFEQQRQLRDIAMVPVTTKHLAISESLSADQNVQYSQESNNSSPPSPKSSNSDTGIDTKNTNNWITVNHDIYGTRSSNQTIINKENVAKLQVKWRLTNDVEIQNPPIVIGNKGYFQDYGGTVIAFDTETGKVLWKVRAGNRSYNGFDL